jgi:hypothetical protein
VLRKNNKMNGTTFFAQHATAENIASTIDDTLRTVDETKEDADEQLCKQK